jgi:lysozyme
MLGGIDVSATWNGHVEWTGVRAAGIQFAFAKASEGMTYDDPLFGENWRGIGAAGLIRGAYHYARPQADRSGRDEAGHMLTILERVDHGSRDLPPAVALEWPHGQLSSDQLHAWVADFVGEIERRISRKPIICTDGLWQDRLGSRSSLGCPLWLAEYGPRPHPPAAWPGWTFWQRTDSARLAGVNGNVDLNLYPGTIEQLTALGANGSANRTPSRTPLAAYPGFPLREGIAGPEVRMWQQRMRRRRWTIAPDGVYGSESAGVCRRFQQLHGLAADGIVGSSTWRTTFTVE